MPVNKHPKVNLKAQYNRNLKLSITIVITLLIAAFKFSPIISTQIVEVPQTPELIKIEDILNTVQKPKPPKPPAPPKIIEASSEDIPEDLDLINMEIDIDAQLTLPPPPDPLKVPDEDVPFYWVEEMPEPIGGIKAIQKKVYYNEIAIRTRIEGTVVIEAVIDKEGNVIDAKIVRDIGGGLGESALKAVLATKFSPGKQRGKPVKVKVNIPVKFVLN